MLHLGTVLVTKNPCLWPGDFRRLTAVNNNRLEQCMRDVIVFPMKGKRPHPNEISGSDLDGDQYWVYWGDELVINNVIQPLEYKSAKMKTKSEINPETIVNHIVESISDSGVVGMIANMHTLAADKNPLRSFSDDCKKLAELFSLAIDAPKTGHEIPRNVLIPYQRQYGSSWPHFMMKYDQPIYRSPSILEELFIIARARIGQPIEPLSNNHHHSPSQSASSHQQPKPITPSPPGRRSPSSLSSASASASSDLPNKTENDLQFHLIINKKLRSTIRIVFKEADNSLHTVEPAKDTGELIDIGSIVYEIVGIIVKSRVFKPKTSSYNARSHGPLDLTVTYGNIHFVVQSSWPENVGALKEQFNVKGENLIKFSHVSIDASKFIQVS
jgi:hypothetical protein